MIKIQFFWNSGLMALSESGERLEDLEAMPWLCLWIEAAEMLGYDPEQMRISLSNGRLVRPMRKEQEWDWEFMDG